MGRAYTHMSFPVFTGNAGFLVRLFKLQLFISIVRAKQIFSWGQLRCARALNHILEIFVAQICARNFGKGIWQLPTENSYCSFFFFFPAKMIQISQKNLPKRGEKDKVKNIGSQEALFHAFPKMFCVVPHTLRSILASILIKR